MPSKPKTARREHSSEDIAVVWSLWKLGYSFGKISKENGLPKSTIYKIIKRARKNPECPWLKEKRPGRPPVLDARVERRLIRYMSKFPFEPLNVLSTPGKSGCRMHINTTRKYLAKNEYYAFRPRRKPYLDNKRKLVRRQWCREMKKLEDEDWAVVAWTDEMTIELGIDTTPPWVRRRHGEAYESKNLKPTFKSGRSSTGVYGAISLNFKSSLAILKKGERMNSERYTDVLGEHLIPLMDKIYAKHGIGLIQQDGARYHTSKHTMQWIEKAGFWLIKWPPYSPDLNPIENLWRIIKLRISKRRHLIHSIEELERVLKEEWDRLTPDDWRNCILSMKKRCELVLKAKGGSIKY